MTSKIVEHLIILHSYIINTLDKSVDEINSEANSSATIYFHNGKLQ
ncbi:hypothetical protein FHS10_000489 [Mucilaginibacter dorajii]|nr:hypothetical protein [Mucilaginibacter dorajii]